MQHKPENAVWSFPTFLQPWAVFCLHTLGSSGGTQCLWSRGRSVAPVRSLVCKAGIYNLNSDKINNNLTY